MALEFRQRRFRKPGKKGQLLLSLVALLLALTTATVWVVIHFRAEPSSSSSDPQSTVPEHTFSSADAATLLLVLRETNYERFVLIQADPANRMLYAAGIPSNLAIDNEKTLLDVFKKDGAAAAAEDAAEALGLTIDHYISCSGKEAETWFNHLDGGIVITLDEAVNSIDHTGRTARFDAGEQTLSAAQAVSLLHYTGWKDTTDVTAFPAVLLSAMINQYLTEDRYLSSDFTQMSNLMKTSLRIGDFNDYHTALQHIAATNADKTCKVVPLYGKTEDGKFFYDKSKTAAETPLYE